MPSILNSDNGAVSGSAGLKYSSDGSGVLALQTNGTTAVTVDASQNVSIPKGVSGTPAFSAYSNGNQSITTNTWTKATMTLEYFDTASAFDSTTNYRFQPNVAGYYQLNGSSFLNSASNNVTFIAIAFYKNAGTTVTYGSYGTIPANNAYGVVISDLIYFNGSTDYVEIYVYASGTSPFANNTRMSGSMVRGA